MPSPITYPGVYVEEVSVRRRISRLGTTSVAFVGEFPAGPSGLPVPITAIAEMEEAFGPGAVATATGKSVEHFFLNRGRSALVVREDADQLLFALDALPNHVDLLLLPDTAAMDTAAARLVVTGAQDWAADKGAIYIIDLPSFDRTADAMQWASDVPGRDSNSVMYYPWVTVDGVAASPGGAVAGVYVRTDSHRGVWKAPAGADALLLGDTELATDVDEAAVGILARAGINAIRNTADGPASWGARTLSSDPEWKYVSVRRLGLLIERSIAAGTEWAVFEPNNAALWAVVEEEVDSFLAELWREGALQGAKAKEAYSVRCGHQTMTAADIDSGRLIIEVGFAPLKPAEFIIIRIQQQTAYASDVPPAALASVLSLAKSRGGDVPLQMLFKGPTSSTKIAVARALAEHLDRPLMRIDLGQLATKYIGETEKNLAKVLDGAAERGAILFFDEADALFGMRSRAKSFLGQERALKPSVLLDRIKQYRGITIFAAGQTARSVQADHIIDFRTEQASRPPAGKPGN